MERLPFSLLSKAFVWILQIAICNTAYYQRNSQFQLTGFVVTQYIYLSDEKVITDLNNSNNTNK